MSIRVAGFYWVLSNANWMVAQYYEHPLFGWHWYMDGEIDYTDEDFEQIGEQIICPY